MPPPTGRPQRPTFLTQITAMDGQGSPSERAESVVGSAVSEADGGTTSEFSDAPEYEHTMRALQERAALNAERARALAQTTQDEEVRDEAVRRNTLMFRSAMSHRKWAVWCSRASPMA